MPVEGIPCDQVHIDMKTRITSYGPHDGIIVCCGVQQGPSMFWPYMLNDPSNSRSIQQFDAAPTFPIIHWPTAAENTDDNRRDKSASHMSNQYYQLTAKDGVSHDNNDALEKVRLNIFETVRCINK